MVVIAVIVLILSIRASGEEGLKLHVFWHLNQSVQFIGLSPEELTW